MSDRSVCDGVVGRGGASSTTLLFRLGSSIMLNIRETRGETNKDGEVSTSTVISSPTLRWEGNGTLPRNCRA